MVRFQTERRPGIGLPVPARCNRGHEPFGKTPENMPTRYRVWIAAEDPAVRESLNAALEGSIICRSRVFQRATAVTSALLHEVPDTLILQTEATTAHGISVLREIHALQPKLPVIAVTRSDLDSAVAAFGDGAYDCLATPFEAAEVLQIVTRASEQARRLADQSAALMGDPESDTESEIVGRSPTMREIFRAVARLACRDLPVLITGEAGTGKELIARALHRHSRRAGRPFVAAKLSGLSATDIERGLFGDGIRPEGESVVPRSGLMASADRGTLFLDPIAELSAGALARLAKFVGAGPGAVRGDESTPTPNVRLIGAITEDRSGKAPATETREAFAEALGAITIRLPPLRERREDIALLLQHHLQEASSELAVTPRQFSEDAVRLLCELDWPGNVAQLATLCRWVTAMSPFAEVGLDDLPKDLLPAPEPIAPSGGVPQSWEDSLRHWVDERLRRGEAGLARIAFDSVENVLISEALRHTHGHRQAAAKLLGFGRNTLTRKMQKTPRGARRS